MDTGTTGDDLSAQVAGLSAQLEALPDEAVDAFIESSLGSFRSTLVPGYRTGTLLGRPLGCSHPYVLHASGLGQTNRKGEFEISVAHLLHCVGPGAPMPGGLVSPVKTGEAVVVPGQQTVAAGSPVTVVTGAGADPALFTATPGESVDRPPASGVFYAGWRGSAAGASGEQKVTIRSFLPDGAVLPNAQFNWHVTLEVWVAVFIGG
jgi:hypothetical protein